MSRFDKKSMDAYKNITAPKSLRARVLTLQAQDKGKSGIYLLQKPYRKVYAIAGCFLFILFLSFVFYSFNRVSLQISEQMGTEPPAVISEAKISRYIEPIGVLSISLELRTHQETEISVSSGYLSVIDPKTEKELMSATSLSFSKEQQVNWIFNSLSETAHASITTTTRNKKTVYTLSFNESTNTWAIIKKD